MILTGVLASGGGTNLQAIIDSCESGILKDKARVVVVISSVADAYALERAKKHNIPAVVVERKIFQDAELYDDAVVKELKNKNVDLVCLAGYFLKLSPAFVRAFPGKILNMHPALLPKFGGKGMYGHRVHDAVLSAKETVSGATVHFVDDEYDHGRIILQLSVPVITGDTCETLAKRVLSAEHKVYPEAILKVVSSFSSPLMGED